MSLFKCHFLFFQSISSELWFLPKPHAHLCDNISIFCSFSLIACFYFYMFRQPPCHSPSILLGIFWNNACSVIHEKSVSLVFQLQRAYRHVQILYQHEYDELTVNGYPTKCKAIRVYTGHRICHSVCQVYRHDHALIWFDSRGDISSFKLFFTAQFSQLIRRFVDRTLNR